MNSQPSLCDRVIRCFQQVIIHRKWRRGLQTMRMSLPSVSAYLVGCVLLCPATAARGQDYGRVICAPKAPGPRLQASLSDLQDSLRRVSGKEFRLETKL